MIPTAVKKIRDTIIESATPRSQEFAGNEKELVSVPRQTGLFSGKLYLAATSHAIAGFCRRQIVCRRSYEVVRADERPNDVGFKLNEIPASLPKQATPRKTSNSMGL